MQRIKNNPTGGNAMIYVLIALALFGALTVTLSSQNNQADGEDIDNEVAALYANELLEYVASAQQVVDMMQATGAEVNDLDFVTPSEAGFNTGSNIYKVFHPQGGGLNYYETFNVKIQNDATSVWGISNNTNVEWTTTGSDDVILTAYFVKKIVCEIINKKITGSTTIPATSSPHDDYFLSAGTEDLTVAECAGCEGYHALCVMNDTSDNYSFYNIIAAQ